MKCIICNNKAITRPRGLCNHCFKIANRVSDDFKSHIPNETICDILEDYSIQQAKIAEENGNYERYSELIKKTIKRIEARFDVKN